MSYEKKKRNEKKRKDLSQAHYQVLFIISLKDFTTIKIKDTHLIFLCLKCNKNHKFNKDLGKRFENT